MKFISSSLLLFFLLITPGERTDASGGRILFLIQSQSQPRLGKFVKSELIKKYGIPKGFITLEDVDRCPRKGLKESLFHVCIDYKGEHEVLIAQSEILDRSYKVFRLLKSAGEDRGQNEK